MKVWTTQCGISKLHRTDNITFLSFINNYLILELKNNNKSTHLKVYINSIFETYVYYEILKQSPLWRISIYNNINNYIYIDIYITVNLIDQYKDISPALNCLFSQEYNKLQEFTKFNNVYSYIPSINTSNIIDNTKLTIKLYNYQKNTLAKMIEIEKNIINFNIEYTTILNFHDIIKIKFDPIKNLRTDKSRFFQIKSNGGILADEMGLGKTITTLALITLNPSLENIKIKYSLTEKYWKLYTKATLIICPSHLIKQWEQETKKTNPKLKVLTIATKKDHERLHYKDIINVDIIITSHQFLMNFKYYPCLHYMNITASMFNYEHRNNILKEYFIATIMSSNTINNEQYNKILNLNLPLFEFFYFHRLVLDEGHEIFGEMLQNISQARYMSAWLSAINANNYWYISGSPFVNYTGMINCIKYLNLVLYDNELNFEINSSTFGKSDLFNNILNKDYLWNNILEKICIRHQKTDIIDEINIYGYDEIIEWITFTDLEKNLYNSKKNKLGIIELQQLCCHPLILDSCRKVLGNIEIDLSIMQNKLVEYHTNTIANYTQKIENLDITNQAYYMLKKSYETILIESRYMLTILNKLNNDPCIDAENNCSICLDNIINGSVTKCGHIFCSICITNCLQYKNTCPICKKYIKISDIYLINKNTTLDPLIEKYGSKLGKIISIIKDIVINPTTRIIIFSQWDYMLSLIGQTLSDNGIANCFVKGNVWTRNSAISKFKNGKTLSGEDNKVIILSLKNSASGTNLTEATHIIFVEPINGTLEEIKAIEGQALGRACRLGQKQKIKLYRFIVKDTIEEDLHNLLIQ